MSSAGRCIARSTSSGMVVGPGIARNSRPARTTIFLFLVGMFQEGMQGNDGKFKPEHDDISSKPSFRGDAKHRTRNLEIPGLVLTHHPGMTMSGSLRRGVYHRSRRRRDPLPRNQGLDK